MKYETISLRDYVGKTLNALYDPRMYVLHGQRVDTGAHGLLCGCEPEAAVHPPRHG